MDKTGYALAEFMTLIKIVFLSLLLIYLSNSSNNGPVNNLNTRSLSMPPAQPEKTENQTPENNQSYDPNFPEPPEEAAFRIEGELIDLGVQEKPDSQLIIEISPELMEVLYNAPLGIKFIAIKES